MKYLLTILLLISVAHAQVAAKDHLCTVRTYPFFIKVEQTGTMKELAYVGVDTVTKIVTFRGDRTIALYHIGRWVVDETELDLAYAAVAAQINDDGTVKNWPLLSDALDRVKEIKKKWGIK